MRITPKNWNEFQHYKDRAPTWIKLHRSLLDDYTFACLPDASRALAPMLWLLASEYENGTITASHPEIAFRLRMSEKNLRSSLNPLIEHKFFILEQDASNTLAECKQDACLEKERETQEQTQEQTETDIRAVAVATRPAVDPFEDFWKAYPKRDGANPRAPAEKKFKAAVRSGADASVIIASAQRYRVSCEQRQQIGTPYVAQAVTWLGQQRWSDYAPSPQAFNGSSEPVPPRPDLPSDAELRARYGS